MRHSTLLRTFGALALAAAGALQAIPTARAVDFKGKQINVLIGFGPGGGYDQYGRLIAMNIARHLPGAPTVVSQNMPGGGSIVAARHIYTTSPKDGTEWGILARDAISAPLTAPSGQNAFDATKFNWLGSPDSETSICFADRSAGLSKPQDLLTHTLVVGADGVGTGTYIYPTVLNHMVGTKFKIVNGYTSSDEIFLAMQRHEVQGSCDSYSSVIRKFGADIAAGRIVILFWAGYPLPQLKDTPSVKDLSKDPADLQLIDFMYSGQIYARPFVAPPGLSPAIYQVLKTAFADTLKDPKTLADAAQQGLEIRPVSAEETEKTVRKAYATPPALIERMKKFLNDTSGG